MKMIAVLRNDFVRLYLRNSSYLCKSRVSFSASFHHFYSTSTENKPIINPIVYDFFLHKHNFSPEAATELSSVIPHLKNPEISDSLLSFLKENEFSNSHLAKILKCIPTLISAKLEISVKPKIKLFQELGFSNNDIAHLCATNASLLHRSANNALIPAVSVLKSLLGSNENVVKLLIKCGWFLSTDLEKILVPNIELFKSRSVPMKQIIRAMHSFPRFMLLNPEKLRRGAEKAEEMGARPSSGMYIHAVRVIAAVCDETWELKLEAFRSLGFSEGDILNAFSKYPPAFAVSVKKMRQVSDVLLSSGKYDAASIVNYPTCFTGSIEKRYKPRLQVLAALEHKKLIKKWPSVANLYGITDMSFFRKYVSPHIDEVGHLFVVKGSTRGESMPVS